VCELNVTKDEINVIIRQLQNAINVCYTAPEDPDNEGYPYATGYAKSAMKQVVEDLQRLM
jgi:hypothetical protein